MRGLNGAHCTSIIFITYKQNIHFCPAVFSIVTEREQNTGVPPRSGLAVERQLNQFCVITDILVPPQHRYI